MAPVRTCIGCRRTRTADRLFRVVRTGDGSLSPGRTLPGRGAWLCLASPGCIDLAVKRHAFGRALRAEVGSVEVESLRVVLGSGRGDERGQGSGDPVL